ncbi:MAG: RraA family protein [Candidatus Abyssobacteria bacterium SURF_5]|uniref:Putative 4-hydroxy-4-methyl-2-oxoglutarate aldolase n=1 Tax=Abyssobacteria bacterium (strain SURF_5) TaxID=2093360 RepID=A0A3A4NGS5_ABYX5|nr:MAG: RraA family protein [Candidatus Abyssubacteria bacterium SURF_5]
MAMPLTREQIEELRKITTPTIINAIETFDVQPRNSGFMNPQIRCILPELGPLVGYAATGKLCANKPAEEKHRGLNHEMWKLILQTPAPRVVVIEDIDNPPCVGSMWGEVNGTIHKALGCIGVVTNGGVRDLDEVRAMGFHFFATHVIPSHAYEHLVEIGTPVSVGGLTIKPGDLLHGDQHGVIVIPHEIAGEVAGRAHEVEESERGIINFFRSSDFNPETFIDAKH